MTNVMRFLDSLGIGKAPLYRDYSKREYKNMFMDMHGCKEYSSMTEAAFVSRAHPLSGNFDLVAGSRIIDYKTGQSMAPKEVQKGMTLDGRPKYFEFQPMIYLSLLRENLPPPHRFSLVYVADNDIRSVTDEDFDIRENIRDVLLIPESMREYLSDPHSPAKDGYGASYSKIVENWGSFTEAAFSRGSEDCASWKDDTGLISSVVDAVGMNGTATNRKIVSGALKKLSDIISAGMHIDRDTVVIPSDTLEKFLSCVDEHHELVTQQYYSEFPASPRVDCNGCDYFRVCTRDVVDIGGGDENE
ncbi:MAG: PD-(D/E)XK nuclease family protein, partial [Candidatus Methanoplasma sp.]|jgi:hypothetical protein|nr:PD-(D/E)XK nuclease family protein [Candidatus Methanoplasma sp.]